MATLKELLLAEDPPPAVHRTTGVLAVHYGFVCASGTGLGASVLSKEGIKFRMGLWSASQTEEETGNWKEFSNLVITLEKEGEQGNLENIIVYFFTDSSTVEGCIYKG